MTHEELIAAFQLPTACVVDQRVPKKNFIETPGLVSADRRTLRDGIEEVRWLASLLPENIGIAAHESPERRYRQIGLLTIAFRPKTPVPRILHLVHRCTAHPLLLVTRESPCQLSLCHKRLSLAEHGKTVLEDHGNIRTSPPLALDLPGLAPFLASLPVPVSPAADLYHLYQRWLQSLTALDAAAIAGTYHDVQSPAQESLLRESIDRYINIRSEIESLRRLANKEKQLSRRVELNTRIHTLEKNLNHLRTLS
jgi:hypothetical protein